MKRGHKVRTNTLRDMIGKYIVAFREQALLSHTLLSFLWIHLSMKTIEPLNISDQCKDCFVLYVPSLVFTFLFCWYTCSPMWEEPQIHLPCCSHFLIWWLFVVLLYVSGHQNMAWKFSLTDTQQNIFLFHYAFLANIPVQLAPSQAWNFRINLDSQLLSSG